jgi:lipoprotein-anchoring transpeptidase ErfK/SrfK
MKIAELLLVAAVAASPTMAQEAAPVAAPAAPPPLTAEAINAAALEAIPAAYKKPILVEGEEPPPVFADAAIAKLQVLLDRAGASPGVIDGFDGDNVRKAIVALELMTGHQVDGVLDPELLGALDTGHQAIGSYVIADEDAAEVTGATPEDYAEKAKLQFLGYASVAEAVAEKFHMDIDLLMALNPGAQFVPGETLSVADVGGWREGAVARIEADKSLRQVRAYDANDRLIVAYPATIGSEDNPSPSGTHLVAAVAPMPNYTYNPKVNFQQGDNTSVLTIPPGPNGPVGTVWIDLTEPTFGIHGTPEPSLIDKTGSHGCVRLTNWDAEELAHMVAEGVAVEFVG